MNSKTTLVTALVLVAVCWPLAADEEITFSRPDDPPVKGKIPVTGERQRFRLNTTSHVGPNYFEKGGKADFTLGRVPPSTPVSRPKEDPAKKDWIFSGQEDVWSEESVNKAFGIKDHSGEKSEAPATGFERYMQQQEARDRNREQMMSENSSDSDEFIIFSQPGGSVVNWPQAFTGAEPPRVTSLLGPAPSPGRSTGDSFSPGGQVDFGQKAATTRQPIGEWSRGNNDLGQSDATAVRRQEFNQLLDGRSAVVSGAPASAFDTRGVLRDSPLQPLPSSAVARPGAISGIGAINFNDGASFGALKPLDGTLNFESQPVNRYEREPDVSRTPLREQPLRTEPKPAILPLPQRVF